MSVNSCLRPLASMDGWSVTTTEGIGTFSSITHFIACSWSRFWFSLTMMNVDSTSGNSTKGFHPIQERVAGLHGSQCGFCTPGMVMTLYSSLKSKPQLTMNELENRFDGNICRCTGYRYGRWQVIIFIVSIFFFWYRPILDAAKSFAVDSDIEDLVCRKVLIEHPRCTKRNFDENWRYWARSRQHHAITARTQRSQSSWRTTITPRQSNSLTASMCYLHHFTFPQGIIAATTIHHRHYQHLLVIQKCFCSPRLTTPWRVCGPFANAAATSPDCFEYDHHLLAFLL